jgi:hypothetical protein
MNEADMKSVKTARPSKGKQRLLKQQIQEYVERYYPHGGKVYVQPSPGGAIASVRLKSKSRRRE